MDSLTALDVLIPEESRCTFSRLFLAKHVFSFCRCTDKEFLHIFGASEYSVTSQKDFEKHFIIIRNSSFNLLDLPYVAMLMCVKYKVVSACYMSGLLLITASCTVCTSLYFCSFHLYKYVLLHAKISKSCGFKTHPSLCKAELFLNMYLSRHF